jgi:predicted transcriptional regulator
MIPENFFQNDIDLQSSPLHTDDVLLSDAAAESESLSRLSEIMQARKISQRRLAKMADVQQSAVYSVLKGKRRASIDFAEKVAEALDFEITPPQIIWPDGITKPSRPKQNTSQAVA